MLRAIPALVALMLLSAACGGGGDKEPAATATRVAVAATADDAEPTSDASDSGESDDSGALGTVFESLLGGGLSGASGSTGSLGAGDPAMKALLPSAEQFPAGFVPFGEFTFSTPDGVSEGGSIDMAMSMAMSGEIDPDSPDLSELGILMAMIMRPEDLQDLGDAFGSIDDMDPADIEAEIRRGMNQAGGLGVGISDVQVFELNGVGDGGFGMQMTFDMGDMFGGLLGGAPDAPQLDSMTMRMHIFAHGDYIGATMRLAYSDTLPAAEDELGLARAIDANLAAAP